MPAAARITDLHQCPLLTPGQPPVPHVGGPLLGPGAPTVLIGGMPEELIRALEASGQVQSRMTLVVPVSGVIARKY